MQIPLNSLTQEGQKKAYDQQVIEILRINRFDHFKI